MSKKPTPPVHGYDPAKDPLYQELLDFLRMMENNQRLAAPSPAAAKDKHPPHNGSAGATMH
ncbi:hypothetical protein [Chitinophaga nivalis]|uniref:Uncharacterized protein n=1 Tax=Chitinophaga nivalis TaxID=2991709 RepID=A0ABT3IGE6_9BACT|nr:hypothetical protein [Chitinophaga nivalis]MCW3467418.1 hypothetical protein [Chitinophaga nivalis]MCW3482890.1 hypothetical protein [Chitinophaga nivalis]